MKKPLHKLVACTALALIAQGAASSSPSLHDPASPSPASGSPTDAFVLPASTLNAFTGSVLPALTDIAPGGVRPILDAETAMIAGAGWRSDFWCGAAAGAGLVLSATGVLTPVGVGLSAAGIYCALYL